MKTLSDTLDNLFICTVCTLAAALMFLCLTGIVQTVAINQAQAQLAQPFDK